MNKEILKVIMEKKEENGDMSFKVERNGSDEELLKAITATIMGMTESGKCTPSEVCLFVNGMVLEQTLKADE